MRGGGVSDDFRANLAQPENGSGGVRPAREPLDPHKPMRRGGRQLRFGSSALGKDRNAAWGQQARGMRQQIRQWRQGAGGDGGQRRQLCGLDPAGMDAHMWEAKLARRLDQKGGFAAVGFNEMCFLFTSDGEDKAWQPTTGAEISQRPLGQQRDQLPSIEDVAVPQRVFWCCRHEVDAAVPVQQQSKVGA